MNDKPRALEEPGWIVEVFAAGASKGGVELLARIAELIRARALAN